MRSLSANSSFYVFNVSYNQSKAILTFLEQVLLEIAGHRQTLVTIFYSVFNDLANARGSTC